MLAPDCTLVIPTHALPIVLHLHVQSLAANSLLLRGIFAGAYPRCVPRNSLPRLLQSPPHPILFLPVPDPPSIQLLFHWIYSRSTRHLEHALHHGHIQWQGIARNVEYLGLPTDIKVFLGRWYRDWFLSPLDEHDGTDESDLASDDGYYSQNSDDDLQSDDHDDRGRSREIKPLVQLCARLRLCTT